MTNNKGEKYGLTDKEVMDKFGHKRLTRIKIKPKCSYLKVLDEVIWGNVVYVLSLTGQGNNLLVDYMKPTLCTTISVNPHLTPINPGTNPMYPMGTTMVARENINYNW